MAHRGDPVLERQVYTFSYLASGCGVQLPIYVVPGEDGAAMTREAEASGSRTIYSIPKYASQLSAQRRKVYGGRGTLGDPEVAGRTIYSMPKQESRRIGGVVHGGNVNVQPPRIQSSRAHA